MKKMKWFSMLLLLVLLMAGCGEKPVVESVEETVEETGTVEERFEGEYLVTAEYLKEHYADDNVLVVDARGEKKAKKGTVEGAIAVTWKELCTCDKSYGEAGDEGWGKIPEPAELSEKLSAYGITMDKEIICFGLTSEGWGDDARLVWEFVAAGFPNVKMVDGGWTAIQAAGVPTQRGASKPEAANVTVESIDNTHVMGTEELTANYDNYVVLDVRTQKEYDGATKYNEAKGGHLPDAIYFPYTELFRSDDTLKAPADIIAMLEAAGVEKDDNIVAYCTGGIRSAYVQLVLEMCGYENTWNYDQSYWRWCVVNEVEK